MADLIKWEDIITINVDAPEAVKKDLEEWLCFIESTTEGQTVFEHIKNNARFKDEQGVTKKLEIFGFNEDVTYNPKLRNRFDFIPSDITPYAYENIALPNQIGALNTSEILAKKNVRYVVVNFNQAVAQTTNDPDNDYSPSIERLFHELVHASGMFGDYENYETQFRVTEETAPDVLSRITTPAFSEIEKNVTKFTDEFAEKIGSPLRGNYNNSVRIISDKEKAVLNPDDQVGCEEYTDISNTIEKLKNFDKTNLTELEQKFLEGFKADSGQIEGFSSILTNSLPINWTPEIAKDINLILATISKDGDNLTEVTDNLSSSLIPKIKSPVMTGKINKLTDELGL